MPDRNSRPPDQKQFNQSSTNRPGNLSSNRPGVSRPNPGNKLKEPTCYSCGRVGHYSSDTHCPNFGQPRMGAIQEAHDHEDIVDEPVDSAETGEPVVEPVLDEAAEPTQDVDAAPEPSDHGLYEDPLVGSQYTSEGEDYPLETYEEYSDYGDGERMMAIRDDHLHNDADGVFPMVVEDSDTEVSEPDDNEHIEQQIQSIHVRQDAG